MSEGNTFQGVYRKEVDAVLFVDTETTGLPAGGGDGTGQPRLVQLAAILAAPQAGSPRILACYSTLIRPDDADGGEGWVIDPAEQAIRGITTDDCRKYGIAQWHALSALSVLAKQAGLLVAHNIDFDANVLRNEYRLTLGYDLWLGKKPKFCTMRAAAKILRERELPWLSRACAYFHDMKNAYDTLGQCRSCMELYFAMIRRGQGLAPATTTTATTT